MKNQFESIFKVKNSLYVREFNPNSNISEIKSIQETPSLFVTDKRGEYSFILDNSIKLQKMTFSNSYELREFEKSKELLYGFNTYGKRQYMYQYIYENYFEKTEIPNSRIWYFDIEVHLLGGFPEPEDALGEVTLIQFYDSTDKKMYVIGSRPYNGLDTSFRYIQAKDEKDIFDKFIKMMNHFKPFILAGWNSEMFDIPYLVNRMKKIGLDPRLLSPVNNINSYEIKNNNSTKISYNISGLALIDMMITYKKFILEPRESYSLNHISNIELGMSKVENTEEDFQTFYLNNFDTFVEYGAMDVELLYKIEEKTNIIAIQKSIAYAMGVNIQGDSLGTVKPWDTYIYNKAIDKGLVLPSFSSNPDAKLRGGWIPNPIEGKFEDILSLDFNSLYPNMTRSANMSPDTKVMNPPNDLKPYLLKLNGDENILTELPEEFWNGLQSLLNKHNYSCTAFGVLFRKDKQGIIPELFSELYNKRVQDKKKSKRFSNIKEKIKNILKRTKSNESQKVQK